MLGRDYSSLGTTGGVKIKHGSGDGVPFPGPIRGRFINKSSMAIIDKNGDLHIQLLSGIVVATISDTEIGEEKALEDADEEIIRKAHHEATSEDGPPSPGSFPTATNYMNLHPTDLAPVPLSRNLAVADGKENNVKFINHQEFYVDRVIGSPGNKPGQFQGLISLDVLKIGFNCAVVTCEKFSSRVQVLTEYGECMATFGGTPGQHKDSFYEPESVSCYNDPRRHTGKLDDPYIPSWFRGVKSVEELENELAEDYVPGNFLLGQREKNPAQFDMVHVTMQKRHERTTVEHCNDGSIYLRTEDSPSFPSILTLVQRTFYLKQFKDKRPSALIAVADTGNRRVQILRFAKWW